jgi:urease accessory protein
LTVGAVLELLLADGRTPTGSFAASGGLEAAGGSADSIPSFMRARLATVGRVDAAFAAAASACGPAALDELLALELEWAARTPCEPLRVASRALGLGLLRSATVWFPEVATYRAASVLCPRPIALGVVGAAGALDRSAVARASLYDDAATIATAAVKLLPLDAAVTTGWVLGLAREIDVVVDEVLRDLDDGRPLPSCSTPLLDQRAVVHSENQRRLFAS